MANIDCESDPEGFHYALEDARELHKQLVEDSKAIKTLVQDQIKSTLQSIKDSLANSGDDNTTNEE